MFAPKAGRADGPNPRVEHRQGFFKPSMPMSKPWRLQCASVDLQDGSQVGRPRTLPGLRRRARPRCRGAAWPRRTPPRRRRTCGRRSGACSSGICSWRPGTNRQRLVWLFGGFFDRCVGWLVVVAKARVWIKLFAQSMALLGCDGLGRAGAGFGLGSVCSVLRVFVFLVCLERLLCFAGLGLRLVKLTCVVCCGLVSWMCGLGWLPV